MNRDYAQDNPVTLEAKNTKAEKPIRVMQVVGRMMGGGVEATVMNYYRHIDRSKVQFDFVIQSDSTVVPREEIESLGGRIFVVPPYSNPLAYMKACRKVFEENKPSIVHSHMNAISVFTLRAAKQAGVPIRIAHSHSTANPRELLKTIVKMLLRPFSKIYPTHMAACGEYSARWLFGDKAMDSGRVKIIRNAIDLNKFIYNKEKRIEMRRLINVQSDVLIIGQVGRLCAQKNQLYSLNVVSELVKKSVNAVLIMIGTGDDLQKIEMRAKELRIDHLVYFLGMQDDVNSWYSAFDVLIFPSLYEGLPLTAIEAQASGLPIVGSDKITKEAFIIPEICEILSLSKDKEAWCNAITNMSPDREKNGLKSKDNISVLSRLGFNITNSANELVEYYKGCLYACFQ